VNIRVQPGVRHSLPVLELLRRWLRDHPEFPPRDLLGLRFLLASALLPESTNVPIQGDELAQIVRVSAVGRLAGIVLAGLEVVAGAVGGILAVMKSVKHGGHARVHAMLARKKEGNESGGSMKGVRAKQTHSLGQVAYLREASIDFARPPSPSDRVIRPPLSALI
jgi:hypothetical protein